MDFIFIISIQINIAENDVIVSPWICLNGLGMTLILHYIKWCRALSLYVCYNKKKYKILL